MSFRKVAMTRKEHLWNDDLGRLWKRGRNSVEKQDQKRTIHAPLQLGERNPQSFDNLQ
jgi:hypothetical protein